MVSVRLTHYTTKPKEKTRKQKQKNRIHLAVTRTDQPHVKTFQRLQRPVSGTYILDKLKKNPESSAHTLLENTCDVIGNTRHRKL